MQYVYKNIGDYNPGKKQEILTLFDDMIAEMISKKKCNQIVIELLICGRKLNF